MPAKAPSTATTASQPALDDDSDGRRTAEIHREYVHILKNKGVRAGSAGGRGLTHRAVWEQLDQRSGKVILYRAAYGGTKLNVRLEGETGLAFLDQMTKLFKREEVRHSPVLAQYRCN